MDQICYKMAFVDVLQLIGNALLGTMLVFAGVGKLHDPYSFLEAVYDHRVVGLQAGLAISLLLPWLEIVAGVCIAFGVLRLGAICISCVMFSAFAVARMAVALRGMDVPCNCFGGMLQKKLAAGSTPLHEPANIGIPVALIIVAVALLYLEWWQYRRGMATHQQHI